MSAFNIRLSASPRVRRISLGVLGSLLLAVTVGWASVHPSHQRTWAPEQRLLPRADMVGSRVTLHNVRDFRWGPGSDVQRRWEKRSYDLDAVESVWYVLTPFSRDRRGPAHAFVSFGFDDGRYLAVSVEARREEGEHYSISGGLLKQYEIMYVVGDERDLIQLRAERGDDVYVYPIRATREQARALLTDMLERVNELHDAPEFYGTFLNNCTTNLLAHVNRIATRPIPYDHRVLLPGYPDEIAHERGLLDTELSLEEARARYLVNGRARRAAGRADYSLAIRTLESDL